MFIEQWDLMGLDDTQWDLKRFKGTEWDFMGFATNSKCFSAVKTMVALSLSVWPQRFRGRLPSSSAQCSAKHEPWSMLARLLEAMEGAPKASLFSKKLHPTRTRWTRNFMVFRDIFQDQFPTWRLEHSGGFLASLMIFWVLVVWFEASIPGL